MQNNRKMLDTDFQDALLRGRKLMKHAFVLSLVAGFGWILVESAKALSVF